MASDRLYKLAAEFNKSQLWHEIMDYQIFGVRLPSGKIGYCSVQGFNDFQISLSVYVGAEGFATYRHSYFPTEEMTDNEYFFHSMERECLQCAFVEKDSLTKEELAEEKNFRCSRRATEILLGLWNGCRLIATKNIRKRSLAKATLKN